MCPGVKTPTRYTVTERRTKTETDEANEPQAQSGYMTRTEPKADEMKQERERGTKTLGIQLRVYWSLDPCFVYSGIAVLWSGRELAMGVQAA